MSSIHDGTRTYLIPETLCDALAPLFFVSGLVPHEQLWTVSNGLDMLSSTLPETRHAAMERLVAIRS